MRGGFAEILRYSYDVAPLRCVDMPTRLQITAFFFIRAIGARKTEQSLRKIEQKKSRLRIAGGIAGTRRAARGARGAGRVLYVGVVEEARVGCYDVRPRKLPIWERIVCLVLRCLVSQIPHARIRTQPLAAVSLS